VLRGRGLYRKEEGKQTFEAAGYWKIARGKCVEEKIMEKPDTL